MWRSGTLTGRVANFLASLNYYQPDCILGTESWLDKYTRLLPAKFSLLNIEFYGKIEIKKPVEEESLLLSKNIMT